MALPKIKEVVSILKFAKRAFTKGGFRHVTNYISGLIASAKKTVKKIAASCRDENHQSALNRILNEAKLEKEELEKRYLKKIRYLFKKVPVFLLIDDTLVERNGKKIEEAQNHFDHNENDFIKGHQFFTSLLYTPFLQLPLFPELYSKNTNSKIDMAKELIDKITESKIKINTVLFDSWYSDEKLIKKCLLNKVRVICGVKGNRNIMPSWKRRWISLSFISERVRSQKLTKHKIDERNYQVWSTKARLTNLPKMKLIISEELDESGELLGKANLISTRVEDTPDEIIGTYKIRWHIETYHRDIKQNLGFAKAFFRRREGIVRHSILATIAYAVLSLFMYRVGKKMTIGECCEYLRNKSDKELVRNIVEIKDKPTRLERFEEVFI